MKAYLAWVKENMITVVSLVVMAAALAVWPVLVLMPGAGFRSEMVRAAETQLRSIDKYSNTEVTIPVEGEVGENVSFRMTINQAAIDRLDNHFARMKRQHRDVFEVAVAFNRRGHEPMIADLFPEPASVDIPFNARQAYLSAFEAMMGEYRPDQSGLQAGMPPSRQDMSAEIAKTEEEYLSQVFPPKTINELSLQEQDELAIQRAERLKEYLIRQARTIYVYVNTKIEPGNVFDIGAWAFASGQPSLEDLWEGQLGLWIQRDIIEAIAVTNHVGDARYSVLNSPVKELMSIRVVPGYIGIDGVSGITGGPQLASSRGSSTRAMVPSFDPGTITVPQGFGMSEGAMQEGMLPSTEGGGGSSRTQGQDEEVISPPKDLRMTDYSVSHTGRRSNEMFDVRQVWVNVAIDSARIPALLESISRTNFMTVLKVDITGIDEYAKLLEGYVYGSDDVVQLSVLIETVWLREWTAPQMPSRVRRRLGAETASPEGGSADRT